MSIRKSFLLVSCVLTALACLSCQRRETVPVESFSLNPKESVIEVGQTLQIETVVTPGNATVDKVTWSSSDPHVAKVSKRGVVSAIKAGNTTITATIDGFEARCELTVRRKSVPATDVRLDRTSVEMYKNETQWLAVEVLPDGFTDEIVWTTSNPAVVEVSDQGKLVALGCGEAVITVTVGTKSATCTVTVTELIIPVTSITLNYYNLHLNKGETEYLTAEISPSDASGDLVWSSSDPSVVSINGDGKVTAEKGGYAIVTATAGGMTAECEVSVFAPVTAVTLGAKELTLDKGGSITLTAVVDPEDATDKTVTWKSLDPNVVSVDDAGNIVALKGGVTKVSAQAGDKISYCTIVVIAPVETVTLNKTTLTLERGCNEYLVATVGPEDATDKTVSWTSSNPAAVSVNDYGKVTAENEGSAIITAKSGGVTADCLVTVVLP